MFLVNFPYKNNLTYTYILHKFSCSHNQAAKISSNMKRNAYISSYTPTKNYRELLTSVVFALTGTTV